MINGSRAAALDFLDPLLVPAAFKFGVQPGIDDTNRFLFADHPLAEGDDIRVVVLFAEPRAILVPANSATDTFDFVGYDGLAFPLPPKTIPRSVSPFATLSAAGRIKSG